MIQIYKISNINDEITRFKWKIFVDHRFIFVGSHFNFLVENIVEENYNKLVTGTHSIEHYSLVKKFKDIQSVKEYFVERFI